MAIFNSYVTLPEGKSWGIPSRLHRLSCTSCTSRHDHPGRLDDARG